MKADKRILRTTASMAIAATLVAACQPHPEDRVNLQAMADAMHLVLESDRTTYTRLVVNRLQNEEKIIKATEHWKEDKTLPLPAQMFRAGAELARGHGGGLSYALLSLWPVNKQNRPRTDAEKTGLQYIVDNKGKNFYAQETLGGKKFFTAVYPDVAVASACVTCHNAHKDSPRTDFKIGDVMGAVLIRIPIDR